jgi:hypothetical protein
VKVLFAGPSLSGVDPDLGGIDIRPPARQGDIHRAVLDGATAIGLVDGVFGFVPSVWHKEILFALSQGVRVLGGASLGALRAAECHSYGMEPVGEIARAYIDGVRDEDADVCLAHCPAELDFMPLSEPLVDVEATVATLLQLDLVSDEQAWRWLEAAREIYFADRTLDAMLERARLPLGLADQYRLNRVGVKTRDALELVSRLQALSEPKGPSPEGWTFRPSDPWRAYLANLPSAAGGSGSPAVPPA